MKDSKGQGVDMRTLPIRTTDMSLFGPHTKHRHRERYQEREQHRERHRDRHQNVENI